MFLDNVLLDQVIMLAGKTGRIDSWLSDNDATLSKALLWFNRG
jgi:hypothetical protein